MHELTIAQNIVETIHAERERQGFGVPEGITVRVGALSGVLPDALQFGFEAIRADAGLATTRLTIESVPVTVQCRTCGGTFPIEPLLFVCPSCNSAHVDVISGYELDIVCLDVPDPS